MHFQVLFSLRSCRTSAKIGKLWSMIPSTWTNTFSILSTASCVGQTKSPCLAWQLCWKALSHLPQKLERPAIFFALLYSECSGKYSLNLKLTMSIYRFIIISIIKILQPVYTVYLSSSCWEIRKFHFVSSIILKLQFLPLVDSWSCRQVSLPRTQLRLGRKNTWRREFQTATAKPMAFLAIQLQTCLLKWLRTGLFNTHIDWWYFFKLHLRFSVSKGTSWSQSSHWNGLLQFLQPAK